MEQVVITVEAVRCFQCQRLLPPQEAFYQRQMMTAVEVGSRTGHTHRYEMVNVCTKCESVLAGIEAEERQRAWWRWFWVGAFLVNCALMAALPVGVFPLYGAIACRVVWKWRAKRQQKIERGQANRGEVPLSGVGILRECQWARLSRVWQDPVTTAYWDIATYSREPEEADVLPAGSVSMDGSSHYPPAALE